jgi:hypothetical protein
MSNRGFLVTGPRSRPQILAESKSYIPPFWLSFLSPGDIEAAPNVGQFELGRKRAIEQSEKSLPFLSTLFPQVADFPEITSSFLEKIRARRNKTIGMDVQELLWPVDLVEGYGPLPNLKTAVEAIESRDANWSLTVPAQPFFNPFTREKMLPERTFHSMQEMLLEVCSILADDLTSRSRGRVRELIVGYVWD